MNIVSIDKSADRIIRSSNKSVKTKVNNIIHELRSIPFNGDIYKKLNGEHLFKEDFDDVEVYSVKIADRLRLVYEYKKLNSNYVIVITDLANHEHRGKPYTKQFTE